MNPQLKRDLELFDKERERLCGVVRKEIRFILERLAKRLNSNKKIEWHCGMGMESFTITRDHDGCEIVYILNGSPLYTAKRVYETLPELEEMYNLIEQFEEVMGQVADYGWLDLRGTRNT